MSKKIILYVLESSVNGKRYIGITNNLPRRIEEHASKQSKGGQLLKNFKVLYTENYLSYVATREREKFLKSGARQNWLMERIPRWQPACGG